MLFIAITLLCPIHPTSMMVIIQQIFPFFLQRRNYLETQDEVTCANTSAIFKNAWWQYRNYLKKTYFTGKQTHQSPLCSPKTHLLDDDWERLVLYWSRTKNVVRCMSSFYFRYYMLVSCCTLFMQNKCLNLKNNCSDLRFHCYHSSKKRQALIVCFATALHFTDQSA